MANCLICNLELEIFMDFGMMPIANSFTADVSDDYRFPMKVGFCENCNMVQLVEQPKRELMFHDEYAFYSSTSAFMQKHFKSFAIEVIKNFNLNKSSLVLEIGCNDGIFLENFLAEGIDVIGVEPSRNVAEVARAKGINVREDFFGVEVSQRILEGSGPADIVYSANVICHIPYLHDIFSGVKNVLKDDGFFIFEDPYLGDIIEKTSFDQIYDEHVFFFSAHSVANVAKMYGMKLVDVVRLGTHGGSMRYIITKNQDLHASQDLLEILDLEERIGLTKFETFVSFKGRVDKIKLKLIDILKKLKKEGKKVVAYGATSKSTTVTNYCGIDSNIVEAIYDTTPIKAHTLSPGTHIPVLPYDDFRDADPDYVLLFAWNHKEEIFEKERQFFENGRKWIVYVPEVNII